MKSSEPPEAAAAVAWSPELCMRSMVRRIVSWKDSSPAGAAPSAPPAASGAAPPPSVAAAMPLNMLSNSACISGWCVWLVC